MSARLVLTCEHASNGVPAEYRTLFRGAGRVLESHRGVDIGAAALARDLARATGAPLVSASHTRLFVELNRSPGHRAVFSEFTRGLPAEERARLLNRFHRPHWDAVRRLVDEAIAAAGSVVHLGVHTFTPVLRGEVRTMDVGLLYDPSRPREVAFCEAVRVRLLALDPSLRVRRNAPYRGVMDGITTALRRALPARCYAGVEIEVNQRFPLDDAQAWRRVRAVIVRAVVEAAPGALG